MVKPRARRGRIPVLADVGRAWLLAVALALPLATPTSADATVMFGSTLQHASQSDGTCSGWFKNASCLLWSNPYTLFAPKSGTVSAVRVRTGAAGGRMQVIVMQGTFQPDFSAPGFPETFVCCSLKHYGPTFNAAADTVVTVPTSLAMVEQPKPSSSINPAYATAEEDFLALSVLDPSASLPVAAFGATALEDVAPAPSPDMVPEGDPYTLIASQTPGYLLNMNADLDTSGGGSGGTGGGPAAPFALTSRSAPIHGGRAQIRFKCTQQRATCSGRLQLQSAAPAGVVPASLNAGRARAQAAAILTYAGIRFSVPARRTRTLRAPLTSAGQQLMRAHRTAKVLANFKLGARWYSRRVTLRR